VLEREHADDSDKGVLQHVESALAITHHRTH
jgi:hypothetical protein